MAPSIPTLPTEVETLIVGSGFSGIAAGSRLRREGYRDFLIVERAATLGGTWRDNSYPGAACDVPSHLYSLSFAQNKEWTRSFSRQEEILDYLHRVARDEGLLEYIHFSTEVTDAQWDEELRRWVVTTSRGTVRARELIVGVGPLAEPRLPDIPGIADFEGTLFHSARWNHDVDLTGKRVAVIGTGASAIQVVPSIADKAGHLTVFQRSAPWVLPRLDRSYPRLERFLLRHVPGMTRLYRAANWFFRELQVPGLTKNRAFSVPLEAMGRRHLASQISDRELRAKVTPTDALGCKRILISSTYYPALTRDTVDVVTEGITEVRGSSIITADGTHHEVDVLIVCTGFYVTESPAFAMLKGRSGEPLSERWHREGMQGYKGTTVHGLPNLFILIGPATGLGHSSMIYMIESQMNYVASALAYRRQQGIDVLDVRRDAQDRYNEWLRQRLGTTVWVTGCSSWYRDEHGNVPAAWPGWTWYFRRMTKTFDPEAYDALPATSRS